MLFSIIFLTVIVTLLFSKLRDVSLRNNLNAKEDKRLVIAGSLIILFIVSSMTLPYPESIYWFLFIGVIVTGIILCYDIIQSEIVRFKKLKTKDRIMNVLFYSLAMTIIHIYI